MRNKKSPVCIKIVGLILSEGYQKCKIFAEKLRKHYNKNFSEPVIKGFLEMDWVEYLSRLRRDVGGQTWAVRKGVVVFLDGVFIGGEQELFTRFKLYSFELPPKESIKSLAKEEYLSYMRKNNLLYTFFELSLDGEYMGSLLFELRPDLLPKTSVRFAMICNHHNNLGYSYKDSKIHRVCARGWFQGGKLGLGSSAGYFEDESFCYKHDRRGVLSMANCGKDSNRTQFFVTFKPSEWMDEYYVAFGRVVEGSDVLRRLENTKCTYEHPDREIKVVNCGIVDAGFGQSLIPKKRMKGLTVGDPHIDLDAFMGIVMDRFDEILFERLDEEVKQLLKGKWLEQMLWQAIQPQLSTREPIADVVDFNDRSSEVFDPAAFIKGLYGLKEIPDHFITEVLHDIIYASVDVVETREMAASIVDFIISNLDLSGRNRTSQKSLVKNVSNIVYGQASNLTVAPSTSSKRELFQKSVSKVASQATTIRRLLTGYSAYSMSQASYVEEEPKRRSAQRREEFRKSARQASSVTTIRKLLTDYQTVSVSRTSGIEEDYEEEGEEDDGEKKVRPTPGLVQKSVSEVVSHTSTVRKLMTDYKRFSVAHNKRSLAGDLQRLETADTGVEDRQSTRESVVGYVWDALFNALKV